MRIIAGKYKNRIILAPKSSSTRPMTDKTKEAVFNVIGPYFGEIVVLDLFAGSGALGFEALSRGAKQVYAVELNNVAGKIINANVSNLSATGLILWKMDYQKALARLAGTVFDLIFIDPPYRLKVIPKILVLLLAGKMVKKESIVVAHYVKEDLTIPEAYTVLKEYNLTDSRVVILQVK